MVEFALLVFGFLSLLWVVRTPRVGGQPVELEPVWCLWGAYSLVGVSSAARLPNRSMAFWPLASTRLGKSLFPSLLGPVEEKLRPEGTDVLPCQVTDSTAHLSAGGTKPLALVSCGGDGFSLGLCSHGPAFRFRLGRSWRKRLFGLSPNVPR